MVVSGVLKSKLLKVLLFTLGALYNTIAIQQAQEGESKQSQKSKRERNGKQEKSQLCAQGKYSPNISN